METKKLSTGKAALIYGLILGAISVAFSIMLYVMDLAYQTSWANTLISLLMIVTLIIVGIIQFRKANGGYLSVMQSLKVGIGVALVGSLLSIAYLLLLTNVIEPDFWDKSFEMAKPAMQEQYPKMTSSQIEDIVNTQKEYVWLTYPTIIIFNLFIGFVVSLIMGFVLKKEEDTDY
ncbi:DUF4199 domain-containing protein [Ascidiimonas sp. W6]|uniref:DUF4199 domain-containing protein n=1 Tax=Ascidiimonas meishanensis TaxID=3128903 RepID=UPI0030EBB526